MNLRNDLIYFLGSGLLVSLSIFLFPYSHWLFSVVSCSGSLSVFDNIFDTVLCLLDTHTDIRILLLYYYPNNILRDFGYLLIQVDFSGKSNLPLRQTTFEKETLVETLLSQQGE